MGSTTRNEYSLHFATVRYYNPRPDRTTTRTNPQRSGTGYSGNLDFMNEQNSYLVEYELGRVGPDCEIYPPEGSWAKPSVEHAAELMRRVVERPEEAAAIGARALEDVVRGLSPQTTGAAMRSRLEQLSGKRESVEDHRRAPGLSTSIHS